VACAIGGPSSTAPPWPNAGFAGEIIAGLAAGEEIRVADRVPVKL